MKNRYRNIFADIFCCAKPLKAYFAALSYGPEYMVLICMIKTVQVSEAIYLNLVFNGNPSSINCLEVEFSFFCLDETMVLAYLHFLQDNM